MNAKLLTLSLATAAACSLSLRAQQAAPNDSDVNEYNRQYRSYYEVSKGDQYTGRSPFMRTTGNPPPPAPQPSPRPEPPRPKAPGCSEISTDLMRMTIQMPPEVTVGQEFCYDLNPTALGCAGDVVVMDLVPSGASFVRSEPPAEVQGDRLIWRLNDMQPGESRNIKVCLKAQQEGRITSCAMIMAAPRSCGSTVVGKPMLALTKTGPETASVGSTISYRLVVANNGTALAKDVVVTDPVPEGLGGAPVNVNVGDLAPGQTKEIPVQFTASQRGRFCNVAVAESSNAGKANAEACTVVLQPGLKITKEGPAELFLPRVASYNIVVSNTGDTTLQGVVVTDTAAAGTSIMEAGGGTVNGNSATWNVGDLAKGDSKTLTVAVSASSADKFCNNVSVASADGLKDAAQACTVWRGVSALLLEKGDHPDPIQVGEQTTYFVRVTNQGFAPDADVKVVVQFPKEITPVSADNGGVVEGQTVTFPPFAKLDPKQAFEYHVIAKGAVAGDARVTFIRTSRDIPAPTSAEESTRVY